MKPKKPNIEIAIYFRGASSPLGQIAQRRRHKVEEEEEGGRGELEKLVQEIINSPDVLLEELSEEIYLRAVGLNQGNPLPLESPEVSKWLSAYAWKNLGIALDNNKLSALKRLLAGIAQYGKEI